MQQLKIWPIEGRDRENFGVVSFPLRTPHGNRCRVFLFWPLSLLTIMCTIRRLLAVKENHSSFYKHETLFLHYVTQNIVFLSLCHYIKHYMDTLTKCFSFAQNSIPCLHRNLLGTLAASTVLTKRKP